MEYAENQSRQSLAQSQGDSSENESGKQIKKVEISARTGKPKRRKAVRACTNCQRTHLTCDDNRPCERCVKRGCADTCQDGARKRSKNFSGSQQLFSGVSKSTPRDHNPHHRRQPSSSDGADPLVPPIEAMLFPNVSSDKSLIGFTYRQDTPTRGSTLQPTESPESPTTNPPMQYPRESYDLNINLSPSNQNFTEKLSPVNSRSSVLPQQYYESQGYYEDFERYPYLSHSHQYPHHHHNHYHNPRSDDSIDNGRSAAVSTATSKGLIGSVVSSMFGGMSNEVSEPDIESLTSGSREISNPSGMARSFQIQYPLGDGSSSQTHADLASANQVHRYTPHNLQPLLQESSSSTEDPLEKKEETIFGWLNPPSNPLTVAHNEHSGHLSYGYKHIDPSEVYRLVTEPYMYRDKLRELIAYLRERLQPQDFSSITSTLRKMKLNFQSIHKSLSREDRLFVEQSFQRSILEEEKQFALISVPCVVWRWTGQISAVSPRFAKLIGSSIDQLKLQLVFHLMDDSSVVQYFQKFKSLLQLGSPPGIKFECTLINAQGGNVKAEAEVTVRRDLFDSPLTVLGKFWVRKEAVAA